MRVCQCEHSKHFDVLPDVHEYGEKCPDVQAYEIGDMGSWDLCEECAINCQHVKEK